ncbi:MAG: TonB-dependent receptor [Gammaproteobacteria bacterium]|nr:TonB-dependent receptor [Gammaproteobacteria bacterium]NNF48860.1 TonB-dependent receptor [Woeseiaceae bacterium]MBT8094709.1 TonB-dependent receptor [Gammaproteobacteria bacterium]MBT8104328.1 TonB-dependent receptor [Gammaproteobacteria bacterium]NNK24344.1 TonB-dependent receptor [Woeseiaceae bacterium]
MSKKQRKCAHAVSEETNNFSLNVRRTAVSLAVAAALPGAMLAPQAAVAQDNDEEVIEEIITTGYRSSLMNSISAKRNASSIVESISAEDIGKLPDASIGESLARLPGLAAQRFDGRANKISIRGLAPDFTTTMLNGRELVSSDNNRAVEYDQFPSELITGATVYKTPDATLTAQAVGGTVDMQTIRPLNYKEPILAVGLRGELNDEGKLNSDTNDQGYRANVAWIGQNDEGSLGWAVGYSRMEQPIQEQYIHFWGYSDVTDADDQSGQFVDGIKPYVKSNELTRDGVLGVLEFAPTDELRARFDVFYSKFADDQTLRGAEIAGYTAGGRDIVSVDGTLVTQGTWNDLYTQNRNDFSDRDVETRALGFNVVYDTDDWSYEADLSWSDAERDYTANELYISDGRGQSGSPNDYTYTLGVGNGVILDTMADFSDPSIWSLGDNLGWGGPLCTEALGWQCDSQDGFRNTETSSDDMTAIKLSAERMLDDAWITSVEFGMRYAAREKGHTRRGEWLTLNDYPDLVSIPSQYILGSTSLDFAGLGNIISFDSRAIANSGIYYESPESLVAQATNTWSIDEDVFNFYIMANFETENWSGNYGAQVVYTDQSSTGTQAGTTSEGVEYNLVTLGTDFWELLPSLNASYHINDDMKLRFGVARILARPRMEEMRASSEFSFNEQNIDETDLEDSPWGGNGGNPFLEPWMAWQFDVSLETYFGNAGYAALSVYHKELENYVYNKQVLIDFSGVDLPEIIDPVLDQGFVSAPDNGEGGWIRGVELSASLPFDLFSDGLRDFGVFLSASYTDSEVQETPDSPKLELPGLSKTVLNGTIYYENEAGFSARVSARHRDEYLAEAFAIGLSRQLTTAKAETIVDAQISWDVSDIWVDGLTFYLQGSNLTNEPFIQYLDGDSRKFRNYHTYGTSYMLGFNYRR